MAERFYGAIYARSVSVAQSLNTAQVLERSLVFFRKLEEVCDFFGPAVIKVNQAFLRQYSSVPSYSHLLGELPLVTQQHLKGDRVNFKIEKGTEELTYSSDERVLQVSILVSNTLRGRTEDQARAGQGRLDKIVSECFVGDGFVLVPPKSKSYTGQGAFVLGFSELTRIPDIQKDLEGIKCKVEIVRDNGAVKIALEYPPLFEKFDYPKDGSAPCDSEWRQYCTEVNKELVKQIRAIATKHQMRDFWMEHLSAIQNKGYKAGELAATISGIKMEPDERSLNYSLWFLFPQLNYAELGAWVKNAVNDFESVRSRKIREEHLERRRNFVEAFRARYDRHELSSLSEDFIERRTRQIMNLPDFTMEVQKPGAQLFYDFPVRAETWEEDYRRLNGMLREHRLPEEWSFNSRIFGEPELVVEGTASKSS